MAQPVGGVGGDAAVVDVADEDDEDAGVAHVAVSAIAQSAAVFSTLDDLAARMQGGHFCGLVSDERLSVCERWTRGVYTVVIVAALVFSGLGLFAGLDNGLEWSFVLFCAAGVLSIPSVYLAAEYADRLPGFSQAVAFRTTGRRLAEEVDGLRGQVDELEVLVADFRGLATRYKAMLRQFGAERQRIQVAASTVEGQVKAMGEMVHSMDDVFKLLQEGSAPFKAVASALVLAEARVEALEKWAQESRGLHPDLPALPAHEAFHEEEE